MKICLQCNAIINSDQWNCLLCGWSPKILNDFLLFADELEKGSVDYPTESHDILACLEENNFWFVSRNTLLVYLLNKYFPNAASFLEIGCGTGFVLAGLARHNPNMFFYGAEAYTSGLIHAQSRLSQAKFFQMDARNVPFSEEFDVIGAFDLLEHIKDDHIVLHQINKALKPGGGIMITVPQHSWLWSKTDDKAGHKRRYSRKELIEKISAAGFNIMMTTSFITLLLPFMAASRFMKILQKNTIKNKPSVGLGLPAIINIAFMKICDLERALIKIHVPMPLGGSLVCVASKK